MTISYVDFANYSLYVTLSVNNIFCFIMWS